MSKGDSPTKTEVVDMIYRELNGEVPKSHISAVIDTQNILIVDTLKQGKSFALGRVGKFEVGETAARKGRNPRTGEEIDIPAGKRIKFKAGVAARREVSDK